MTKIKRLKNDDAHVWNKLKTSVLPSQGKAYGALTSLSWRSLLCLEIKKIMGVGLENKDYIEIYKNVIQDIDIQDLSPEDTKYLQLLVALQTTPDMLWNLKMECVHDKCKHTTAFSVNPKSFEFTDMKASSLPIKLKWSEDHVISFDIIRNRDLELIEERVAEGLDLQLVTLATMARSHEFQVAYDLFANCNANDMQLLAIIDDMLEHSVLPHEVTCGKCKKKMFANIGLEVADIAPFRKYNENDRGRISFGN